jgi:DNA repair protein SbcC/Rad50
MIPKRLNVRNFMSYTDVHEPLCFDGLHVAVLTGDNGHGKSALLDAITWALWGRARAKSVDELIHTGAAEMEVEFEFELDNQQYRVIRKRQRRGKYGTSDLQFAIRSDSGYRPLTERSVGETERLIERTLHMSYETFTNSSFLQQGRADSFTLNSPAERKRVLAEILELGYYDELEARAKERYKACEAQLADERRLAQQWEQEIARRPEYQAEVDRLRTELIALEQQLQSAEQQCSLLRDRVATLETLQRQLEELDARLQRLSSERTRVAAALEERHSLRHQVQLVLTRAADIEEAARQLDDVRRQLEETNRRQQQFVPLERAREAALRTLAAEEARIQGELSQTERRIAELRRAAERADNMRTELRRAQQAATSLADVEARHARLQQDVARCREEAAERRTVNTHLKEQMLDLRRRMDELNQLSACPTCQRPMDEGHKRRLHDEYTEQGTTLREQFRSHEAMYRELDARIERDQAQLALLEQELAGRETMQRRLAQAERGVAEAEDAQRALTALEQERAQRQVVLRERRFAPEACAQLAQVEQRIHTLGYDEDQHRALRARIAELEHAERERQLLEQARMSAEHLDAQLVELSASLQHITFECEADRTRRDELAVQTQHLPNERARLTALETDVVAARRAREECHEQSLFAQARLDNCAFLERKQRDSLVRQDALRREQSVYGDLAYAFGRRGVQAMIIETAIPEIEEEANRILWRMTDGRMHVKFETQRDVRSGTGTVETLDIKIADELGTRSYELFSGGEGFRVNFAIRIALSRLLAHRAGTRLQMLVVDEGMGSQDQDGRDRMVEAIQAIESEFEKILIVTHLEDLRERFPARIEVTKTPRGSTYALR